MTYELSEKEREGVLAASDEKRYGYFLNKAADWGDVWALANGDALASITIGDQKYFPVWPHPGFAEESIKDDWQEFVAEPIDVHRFVDICRKLEEVGDHVALFRTPDGDFITIPPRPLADDLRAALAEVE